MTVSLLLSLILLVLAPLASAATMPHNRAWNTDSHVGVIGAVNAVLPGIEVSPASFGAGHTYASIQALVTASASSSTFRFDCGDYYLHSSGTGDSAAIAPKAGDVFLGANPDGSWPASITAVLPASPPCVHLSGAIVLSHWTSTTVGRQTLWYDSADVGSGNSIVGNGNGSCDLGNPAQNTANTSAATGASQFWQASHSFSLGTRVVDGWGNTWQATVTGATAATAPNWCGGGPFVSCADQADNAQTWHFIVAAAPTPPFAGSSTAMGSCSFPQELFYTPSGTDSHQYPTHKYRTLVWPPQNADDSWYMDYENRGGQGAFTVWTADDPRNNTVELTGPLGGAFSITVANVAIQNFTVEKFSVKNQSGGSIMMSTASAQSNTINGNWLSHSHGVLLNETNGVANDVISYNVFEAAGQNAYDGGGPTQVSGTQFIYNIIEHSDEDNVAQGWDGSLKFANASSFLVQGNESRFNNGNGLWCDSYCDSDARGNPLGNANTFTGNNVHDNYGEGIRYEISQGGIIQSNTLSNNEWASSNVCAGAHAPKSLNGQDCCTGFGTGTCTAVCAGASTGFSNEISIALSGNMTVGGDAQHGNTITGKCAGMLMSVGTRAGICDGLSGRPAVCNTVSDAFSYNTVNYTGGAATIPHVQGFSTNSASGLLTNDLYDHNSYHMGGQSGTGYTGTQHDWQTGTGGVNTGVTFANFQAAGQEANGSASN